MGKKIAFCMFFVGFQGVVKNKLKVVGRVARMVSLRHECVRGVSNVRVEKKMVNSWVSVVYPFLPVVRQCTISAVLFGHVALNRLDGPGIIR